MAASLTKYLLVFLAHLILKCSAFWFYGYDRVFRDPYPETKGNDIAATNVITYLASRRNDEVVTISNPYTYKLFLFESVIQYQTADESQKWNLGVWETFIYCDEKENTLCLYFSDGEYCDNGYFRETAIQLTCNYDGDEPTLYSVQEIVECVYTAKLYFPELCRDQGQNTHFLRSPDEIDKIKASSYISSKGNRINTLPFVQLSDTHNIGMKMVINEIKDEISITLFGPQDQYFAVGFGSNGMKDTYAIVVDGHFSDKKPSFFEQVLGSHQQGYTIATSFVLDDHQMYPDNNVHSLKLSRKLSSSVEIDEYWLFSCIDDYIDVIWSVGKGEEFERHIAFGEDRLSFKVEEVASYDKSKIVDGAPQQFKLKINWTSVAIMSLLGVIGYFMVKRYRTKIVSLWNEYGGGNGSVTSSLYPAQSSGQYGSAAGQDDDEPLLKSHADEKVY